MSDHTENLLINLLGRNLKAFQLLEYYVKALVDLSMHKLEVIDKELIENDKMIGSKITLGRSIPEFLKILEDKGIFPDSEDGFFISLKISWLVDDNQRNEWMLLMKSLIEERNWLVHQSYIDFSISGDDKESLLKRIEAQFERTQKTIEILKAQMAAIAKAKKNMAPDLIFIVIGITIFQLKKIKKDKDGWVLFQSFVSHFNNMMEKYKKEPFQIPLGIKMDIEKAKKNYESRGFFEFKSKTINNQSRVYIRLKNSA